MPLDIDGQLDFVESFLKDHAGPDTRVILMGHSLGAYLIMEMLRRRRTHLGPLASSVVGAIGLFPAVVHLAQSAGGRRIQRLLDVPCLALFVMLVVRIVGLLPTRILQHALKTLLGYPEHSATTTVHWLQSPWGFPESIHLLREELSRITADAWDDQVWESRVHLLFGERDEYVPNFHRDALISARNHQVAGQVSDLTHGSDWAVAPCMEFAATGIPHDFSIRHSGPVAERAADWVIGMIGPARTR
ncbi:uncharacterized protein K460DRAFT_23576 [Cucurbitaria berberidis CBS 394.84]|uniref:Uncharacterized protein n=1 Tax=Cucurbitaria berberidis CBS 394.84 TaxID=1168544 RepID=A0A9P4GSA4_9PLEO|nr:uncharacterized protein K460DRAFT_23576 [Cucurbitaria berberidis CBS 394.84]KAF1850892.1 hypothetical protein K460DRAFT_23576 [Cucurbitaria berberidis CBS 394.84]